MEGKAPVNALPFFVRDHAGKRYAAASTLRDAVILAGAYFSAVATYSPTFEVVEEATQAVVATIGQDVPG
jgi:hypothetical protein